ncbi:hypothetical protein Q4565_12010 [Leptospira santarosai]|nr:hypothetical protein [Leptospira santarosai]
MALGWWRDMGNLRKNIINPIIERANVLKKESVSGSDYSQVARLLGGGGIGQTNFNGLHSGIRGIQARKSSTSCEREWNRSCSNNASAQWHSKSVIRKNPATFKDSSKVNKILINSLDNINILLTLFPHNSRMILKGGNKWHS